MRSAADRCGPIGCLTASARRSLVTPPGYPAERMKRERASVTENRRVIGRLALGTALVLLVPLLAMQFTDEVDWTLSDFLAAGALLFGAGLAYQLAAPRVSSRVRRAAVGLAIGAVLLIVWIALAVGIP